MKGRHEARELAIQFLFQRDFNRGDLEKDLELFWAGRKANPRQRSFAESLIRGVEDHIREIDKNLQQCAEHWSVRRMGGVDRNVMRVALYEMLFCPEIPPVVSINEAVDIAKDYSGLESGKFVNGILDRASRGLTRPLREAQETPPKPAKGT